MLYNFSKIGNFKTKIFAEIQHENLKGFIKYQKKDFMGKITMSFEKPFYKRGIFAGENIQSLYLDYEFHLNNLKKRRCVIKPAL